MKKWLAMLAVLLLLAPAALAQGMDNTLHLCLASDLQALNVHGTVIRNLDTPALLSCAFLYRAVPDEDGEGFHYVGDLASALPERVSEDTWNIRLRPEACWANGDPINADTVVYSFRMLLDPRLNNPVADALADYSIRISGAMNYKKQDPVGSVSWKKVGISAIDSETVQIRTTGVFTQEQVAAQFIHRATAMVYEPFYEAGMNADRTETAYGTEPGLYMSAGPYMLSEWERGAVQTYIRNESYWMPELFHYDGAEIRIIPGGTDQFRLWEEGRLDEFGPDADTLRDYPDDPRLQSAASMEVMHLDINSENPDNPLCGSIHYRRAIYHALNREVLARDCLGQQEPVGWYINGQAGMLRQNGQSYRSSPFGKAVEQAVNDLGPAGYNPRLAREELQAAWEECGLSEDAVVTLHMPVEAASDGWMKAAEFLAEDFPVIFEGRILLETETFSGISTAEYKRTHSGWDLSPNAWSRSLSRVYPHACFYYFLSDYPQHPNTFLDPEFEAQYHACDAAVREDITLMEETRYLEEIALDRVIVCPVAQVMEYRLFSERLRLPVSTYLPGVGWGLIYGWLEP